MKFLSAGDSHIIGVPSGMKSFILLKTKRSLLSSTLAKYTFVAPEESILEVSFVEWGFDSS